MLKRILKKIIHVNWVKTLFFNLRYLPFKQAVKLPVFIFWKTEIINTKGKIFIEFPVKTGMIQFHNHSDEFIGSHFWRRIEIHGELIFRGGVGFGAGTILFVRKGGKIIFGNNIIIGGKTRLLCEENIQIGNNVRITHECQIMDSNFHYVRNVLTNKVKKYTDPIIIGSNCWIGNRTTIMKGTVLPDFVIVSSNSLLNKDYSKSIEKYSVIGGTPAKLIMTGYERIFDLDEEEYYNKRLKQASEDTPIK